MAERLIDEGGSPVEYHLDRGLRLNTELEHKNFYSWAINEIDDQGQVVGGDQIPWDWSLSFKATSCVLTTGIGIKTHGFMEQPLPVPEIEHPQSIRATLRPGHPRDDDNYFRQTTYSMFGTNRAIESFELDIRPISDSAETESCLVWGTVSYTAEEIDFLDETTPDTIIFHLRVKPEMFGRYAALISQGAVNELILRVSAVAGFYSQWSPSVSTRDVKVLTTGDEHKISQPAGFDIEVPRLGAVGEVELFINRRLVFGGGVPDEGVPPDVPSVHPLLEESPTRMADITGPQVLQAILALKRAAWAIVALLTVLCLISLRG